jgi:hypothetical protein
MPKGAFDFVSMLNGQDPVLLTGVFLPKIDYWSSLFFYSGGAAAPLVFYTPEQEVLAAADAIPLFRKMCAKQGIEYRVHVKNYENIKEEIQIETRFADLLVFSDEAFYRDLDSVTSVEYTDNALHVSECPVVVVPEQFREPKNIVLAYDGSASSVFAIRQFAGLMPRLSKLETLLVYVNPDEEKELPQRGYIEELAARHFPNLKFLHLDVDAKKYFITWLADRPDAMLVAGAGGRGEFSELFRRSFIRDILKEHLMPVFIAHR